MAKAKIPEQIEENIEMPDQEAITPTVAPVEGMKVNVNRGRTYAEIRKIFLSTPERKSYTMLGLTLVALILVVVLVVRPMLITIGQRRSEIEVLENDGVFLNQRISTVLAVQEDIKKYKEELETFSNYFPENQNTSALISDIIEAAEQLGLEVIDISTSRAGFVEDQSSVLVPAWMTVTIWSTERDGLIELMYELEGLPTFPSIETVSILADEGLYQAGYRIPIYTINPEFKLFEAEK